MSDDTTALMRRAYQRWAPIYDVIYDKLTEPAARAVVAAVERCGPRILEVGVGTGLSLGYYEPGSEVHGVDLSEDMLRRARRKVERRGLRHVKGLAVMDATRLGFADASFDAVAAQFLITLVPDPEAALDEMARILRPGGEIVLVNHFGQDEGPLAQIEKALAPVSARIGWSSDFKASRVTGWARRNGLEPLPLKKVFPGGFFKLLRMRKPA
ncbi:class I SAM-dependent methyltransferase [Enterovirga rhinocerotis]|uniref:Phosphatidylethanolamine/phosphatidyl-N-methylethanolamine N-methyltransferase n=1 Tax=Enterovirga rhinocerotis TaxID=1339210 RepID=A0A4V3DXW6_9HYPH|nr:class I SAM-dependent methyltransferase [Enterovirga rhinocerotis]TDR90109.1 phosphatidylethanolamine/phosphatidyl-N-methylethanolamine N-methyltransferase [Enterovirga rhinocerotis]